MGRDGGHAALLRPQHRNIQFDLLDPINEPDWDGFEGPQVDHWQYPRLMQKLSVKLDAMGLGDLRFVGPNTAASHRPASTTICRSCSPNSVVMSKLDHFGFHNYAGQTGGADARIKGSAYPQKNFWMTEVSIPGADLHDDRSGTRPRSLIWDAYDSVYNHAILAGAFYNDGRGSTPPNDAGNLPALMSYNASSGVYTARPQFYQMQTFKYVMPGSIRIGATESNSSLTVYAFRHPTTGRVTIVGRNIGGSSITLNGSLSGVGSVGALQFYQTSISNNYNSFTRGSDAVVTGGSFIVTVPANSYFTLTSGGNSECHKRGDEPACFVGARLVRVLRSDQRSHTPARTNAGNACGRCKMPSGVPCIPRSALLRLASAPSAPWI